VVAHPTAFLVTTTVRLALNAAQSARVRRETVVGTWTPEPVDHGQDVTAGPEHDEAIQRAVGLLVQRLTPSERAAYVRRRGFDYRYAEIGELLGVSTTNVRQLVSRAHKHLTENRQLEATPDDRRLLARALTTAARHGDLSLLEHTLLPASRPVDDLAPAA
jgi:RNA polymerase sigma-70 factor (ECF subfamily)